MGSGTSRLSFIPYSWMGRGYPSPFTRAPPPELVPPLFRPHYAPATTYKLEQCLVALRIVEITVIIINNHSTILHQTHKKPTQEKGNFNNYEITCQQEYSSEIALMSFLFIRHNITVFYLF